MLYGCLTSTNQNIESGYGYSIYNTTNNYHFRKMSPIIQCSTQFTKKAWLGKRSAKRHPAPIFQTSSGTMEAQ